MIRSSQRYNNCVHILLNLALWQFLKPLYGTYPFDKILNLLWVNFHCRKLPNIEKSSSHLVTLVWKETFKKWPFSIHPDWKRQFRDHGIEPDVIRRIPDDRLDIFRSDGSKIKTASSLAVEDLTEMPKFKWKSDPDKLYSLFLLNPDVPSRREAFEVFESLFFYETFYTNCDALWCHLFKCDDMCWNWLWCVVISCVVLSRDVCNKVVL